MLLPIVVPECVDSENLVLRAPRVEDLDGMFEILSDERVVSSLGVKPMTNREHVAGALRLFLGRTLARREFHLMVALKSDPTCPVGWIIVRNQISHLFPRCAHLEAVDAINHGMFFAHRVWGKRVASEAHRALLGWLMAQPQVARVYGLVAVDNVASLRLVNRSVLQLQGYIEKGYPFPDKEHPKDAAHYSISKIGGEWR